MRQLHLMLALMLALVLPLQSLAAPLGHECAPPAAGTMDHADHANPAPPMPDADSAHDCCGEPCDCPVQDTCTAPASAALGTGHGLNGVPAVPAGYAASPVKSPQTAHRLPLNRPPIAS